MKRAGRVLAIVASWVPFSAWVAFATLLSATPAKQLPRWKIPLPMADKIAHWLLFFIGSALLALALRATFPAHRKSWHWLAIVLALGAFGVINEVQQVWTPGRHGADWGDMIANLTGVISGSGLFLAACILWEKMRTQNRLL
jgi:VanZ family protein